MSQPSRAGSDLICLLDANVLITAHRDYYPVTRVPEFWDWLLHHAEAGRVKMPLEILDEESAENLGRVRMICSIGSRAAP